MHTKSDYLNISVQKTNGKPVTLKEVLGTYVVLYFYPKDDTPGCTTEACSFRDANEDLKALEVTVIGVSKDSPESHQKFAQKYNLHFELWSDQNLELMKAFDAYGEKTQFGKTSLGVKRSTVILNPEGDVIKHYKTVKPAEHTQQVLKFLQKTINS
jgi:peroxiredoxin Q/BCP